MDFSRFLSFWGHHFIMVAIWITLTLSLNLINGFCGLFSLGHQGFWMVGAYAAGITVVYMKGSLAGFVLSFFAGMLAAAVFGVLVGLPCLRLKGDYLAIATLGFSEILRNVVQNSETLGQSLGLQVPNVIRQMTDRNGSYMVFLALAWAIAIATLLLLGNLIRIPRKAARDSINPRR